MKKSYDIAVIGESMAGKSTWIARLLRDDVGEKLNENCKENEKGQTKVGVHYLLQSKENFELEGINDIEWIDGKEGLIEILSGERNDVEDLINFLKISSIVDSTENDNVKKRKEQLDNYFESEEYKKFLRELDPYDFIRNIVNSNNKVSEFIRYVEICVPVNDQVKKVMCEHNLGEVKLRDIRGFLDDTKDKYREYLIEKESSQKENNKSMDFSKAPEVSEEQLQKEYIQKIMDDRGLIGIEACVFISRPNDAALSTENSREMYGPLIMYILERCPMHLVVRTDRIIDYYWGKDNTEYEEMIAKDENNKFKNLGRGFTAFNDLRKLMKSYGLGEKPKDYRMNIAQNHYKELILAEVDKTDGDELRESEKIYRKTAVGVFSKVLDSVEDYFKELQDAEKFLKWLKNKPSEIMNDLFDKKFAKKIRRLDGSDGIRYDNGLIFSYYTWYISDKVQKTEWYYGGMVGSQGGLTTRKPGGGKVGDEAICILESAYSLLEELIFELVQALEPEIKKYAEQYGNKEDILSIVQETKGKIFLKYVNQLEREHERLSCTNRMVNRIYLHKAYYATKAELDVKKEYIGKYCKELERLYPDEQWLSDRHQLSVVKRLLWHLIDQVFPKENINETV